MVFLPEVLQSKIVALAPDTTQGERGEAEGVKDKHHLSKEHSHLLASHWPQLRRMGYITASGLRIAGPS